ncbi:MAG: LysE family translocator [Parvularculaceae bacterium]|nr:LysE family translocator [Parvularculaceae bacterium]
MIFPENYPAFCAAAALLIATPGPMVALILAGSVARGAKGGFTVVAGAAAAMLVHLALVTAGLAALLARAGDALFCIKWAGAAYLFVLGAGALLKTPVPPGATSASGEKSLARIFGEAFLLGVSHPKTLLFYVAFFPAFVDPARPATPQVALLSATFFVIAVIGDSAWAATAASARPLLARAWRRTPRVSGVVLILAAIALALMQKT